MRILFGAAVSAMLVGAGACVTSAPAIACPYGTVASDFSGVCVSAGNGSEAVPAAPEVGAAFGGGPNELPSVDGVPCTPLQLGTCIGLAENAR